MADDTRQRTSAAPPPSGDATFPRNASPPDGAAEGTLMHPNQREHKRPRVFMHKPEEDPEAAAEARRNASVVDAAKTITLDDFWHLGEKPCVRNGLLPGIGGGAAIGAARFVLGGSIMMACNWATGTFAGISLIAYQWCQRRREIEKNNVRQAIKVLDEKQALKEAQEKAGGTGAPAPEKPAMPAAAIAAAQQKQGVNFWSSFKFW